MTPPFPVPVSMYKSDLFITETKQNVMKSFVHKNDAIKLYYDDAIMCKTPFFKNHIVQSG